MCVFIKRKKLVFVNYDKYDPSSTVISPSYQGSTASKNEQLPEEHKGVTLVQAYDNHKSPMQQHALENKMAVHHSVPDKHTEAIKKTQSTRSNLGQRLSTYAQ